MFKVECEGCKAPYQIEERRVPAGGLKMRCPQCGASFLVRAPASEEEVPDLPARAAARPSPATLSLLPSSNGDRSDLPVIAPARGTAASKAAANVDAARSEADADLPSHRVSVDPAARSPREAPPPRTAAAGGAASAGTAATASFELDLPATAAGLPDARPPVRPAPPRVAAPPPPRVAAPRALAPPPAPAFVPPAPAPTSSARASVNSDLPAVFGGASSVSTNVAERGDHASAARAPAAPPPRVGAGPADDVGLGFDPEELSFDLPGAVDAGLPAERAHLPAVHAPAPVLAAKPAPQSSFGEIDLPLLSNDAPALAAGLPRAGAGSPTPVQSSFDAGPSFALESDRPPPPSTQPDETWAAGDELDDASLLGAPSAAPLRDSERQEGAAFGDLTFAERPSEAPLAFDSMAPGPPSSTRGDGPSEDDMEFGEIPQQKSDLSSALSPELAAAPRPVIQEVVPAPVAAAPRSPHRAKIVASALALAVIGGASLEVMSTWGAFGRHALLDLFNRDALRAVETSTMASARAGLSMDTFRASRDAIALVDQAIARSPRAVALLPYGAFIGYATELRYGRSPLIDAHAKQQLAQAIEREPLPFIEVARAAEAAVESQLPRAKQTADALAELEPQNIEVALLVAEVHFLAREFDKALESWTRAAKLDGGTARSAFGIARALSALGRDDAAMEQAKKVLALSPNHVGARLLVAHALWSEARDEAGAMASLAEVTRPGPVHEAASALELVDALTLTALVHMSRSRMSPAEAALTEALAIEPKAASALAAMGEVLYREGRFTDALARFDAGIQADPEGTAAKIGAAKTKIALERLAEAKDQLKKLRDARPNDPEVIYWLGRSEDALGDRVAALRAYRQAIGAGPGKAQTVEAYIAVAQILSSDGKAAEAEQQLTEAKAKLPRTPSVNRALGDVHLAAGRYDAAKAEFEAAIALDPGDIASRFRLGVVAERMGNLDEAERLFAKVADDDPEYPGLALERGLLYEARNQRAEALSYYQQALSKAPDDPDLMLRVGSAEVISGHAVQAEEILRRVIGKRPNSAEVNHYLGRALLLKGNNLAESLRYLKRAADIDPHRAEYHLYVGWAANEVGQPAVAQDELTRALELDKGLADAYWQQGVLQRKQGAVFDAVKNLKRALELRPSRYEAYATLAECYEDQNKLGEAIAAWRKAVASDGNHGEWHYRLGKLLGRAGEGELREAVDTTENVEPRPPWLAQAYFELADIERGSGKRDLAVAHYRKFLASAKVDSPYRPDAVRALAALGSPYDPAGP